MYRLSKSNTDEKTWQIIKYLVEERKLKEPNATIRALANGNIELAKYLDKNGSKLSNGNHIYNRESIKFAIERKIKFDEKAISCIFNVWNIDCFEKFKMLLLYEKNIKNITLW